VFFALAGDVAKVVPEVPLIADDVVVEGFVPPERGMGGSVGVRYGVCGAVCAEECDEYLRGGNRFPPKARLANRAFGGDAIISQDVIRIAGKMAFQELHYFRIITCLSRLYQQMHVIRHYRISIHGKIQFGLREVYLIDHHPTQHFVCKIRIPASRQRCDEIRRPRQIDALL